MLRVSKLTDYGTLVMSLMASVPGQVFSASDLASQLGLGAPTVSKVLKSLARHDLVASVRGPRGGYLLSRAPECISLADIVDALEEQPFGLTECSAHAGLCDIEVSCRVRDIWLRVSKAVRGSLEAVSLADMMAPVRMPITIHRRPTRGVNATPAVNAAPPEPTR